MSHSESTAAATFQDLASEIAARCADARVSASRTGGFGVRKAAPGRCRPMTSISIWLLLAVP